MKMHSNDKNLVVIGRKEVVEAIQKNDPIQKVMFQKGITGELEVEIRNLCKQQEIPFQVVPKEQLNKVSSGNHQGLLAIRSPVRFYTPEDVINRAFDQGQMPLIAVTDQVQDVRNLGAIARSCLAFGVHGLMFPSKGSAMINDFAIKTSAGAILDLPMIRVRSLGNAVESLKTHGLRFFGANHRSKTNLKSVDFSGPSALVFGSEGEGFRPHIQRMIDQGFRIEQSEAMESLNVSVATGIVLHHIFVQRKNK